MIVIAGTMPIKPEAREQAVAAALEMAAATRQEAGCITYRFFAALDDPDTILIFEEWESEAALQAHFQTAHMAAFRQVLPAVVAGSGLIYRYEVSQRQVL